jgi:hypothetical protein
MFLLPPFLVMTLCYGGVMVPRLNLILNLICGEYLSERAQSDPNFSFAPIMLGDDNPQCRAIDEVQARVSQFTLLSNLISGILAAMTAPKLGALSDRYGRLNLIVITGLGGLVMEGTIILAANYPEVVHVNWLLAGAAIDGLCGSFISSMAITHAYATDCTSPNKRAVTFAYLHGCLFTGIALGPLLAAWIIEVTGKLINIFYAAMAGHLFFILCLLFIIPESLTKARQYAAREKQEAIGTAETRAKDNHQTGYWYAQARRVVRFGGLFDPLTILWPTGPGSSSAVRRNLVALAAVDTTMFGVAMGSMSVVILYSGHTFNWNTVDSSKFVSIVNICRVSVLLVLLPGLVRLVRGPHSKARLQPHSGSDQLDLYLIRGAVLADAIGYFGYATSMTGTMFLVSGCIAALGGMGSPTLQAALTKHVPPDRTGQLLGAIGLLHALARVVAPVVFNTIYAKTVVTGMPQFVFFCLAGTWTAAFLLSWVIRPHGEFSWLLLQ